MRHATLALVLLAALSCTEATQPEGAYGTWTGEQIALMSHVREVIGPATLTLTESSGQIQGTATLGSRTFDVSGTRTDRTLSLVWTGEASTVTADLTWHTDGTMTGGLAEKPHGVDAVHVSTLEVAR